MNLKKKLLGLVLTTMIVVSSGMSAFAQIPEGAILLHGMSGDKDVAYSEKFLDSKYDTKCGNLIKTAMGGGLTLSLPVYLKQNGEFRHIETGKILDKKEINKTLYFGVKNIMEIERTYDCVMDNKVFSVDLLGSLGDETGDAHSYRGPDGFYPIELNSRAKKLFTNGIVGDFVVYVDGFGLVDTESNRKVVKRSDYPRMMKYYYTDLYEAGDGEKLGIFEK